MRGSVLPLAMPKVKKPKKISVKKPKMAKMPKVKIPKMKRGPSPRGGLADLLSA